MTAKGGAERALTLDVVLLGREYKVACKESERAELKDAVAFLDARMREIRDRGKVAGGERIAVMAALNIANELLRSRAEASVSNVAVDPAHAASAADVNVIDDAAARRRISAMHSVIDQALTGFDKLS